MKALDPENRQRLHLQPHHQDALEPAPLSAAEVSSEERTDV
jgi:hypothetical protein